MANPAVFTSPLNRNVLTVSVAKSIAVTATSDSTGSLYVDGVLNSAMTNAGGGLFTGSWTPGVVAASNSLTFVGDITGTSAAIIVTVDSPNTITSIIMTAASWTKSNVTITDSGITSPGGVGNFYLVKPSASGSARRLFYPTISGAGTINFPGFECWVGVLPGSVTKILSMGPGNGQSEHDIILNENNIALNYSTVVERKTHNGIECMRIQWVLYDASITAPLNAYMDLMQTMGATTYTLDVGDLAGSGMYISEPRRIDDVKLPFTINEKLGIQELASASTALAVANGKQFYFKHRYVDQDSNTAGGGIGGTGIRIILPSNWTPAWTGPALILLKALSDAAEASVVHKTPWETAVIDDYANVHGCVVAVVDERASEGYWGGVLSTGNKNMFAFYPDVVVEWLRVKFGVGRTRNDLLIAGYSKSGNLAIAQILKRPDIWGQAGSGDGVFLNVYPANDASINYDVAATYNGNDPVQILTSNLAGVTDRRRITLFGGFTWNTVDVKTAGRVAGGSHGDGFCNTDGKHVTIER